MDDDVKQRLTRRDVWVRLLYMIFFAIAYSIAEVVLGIVTLVQFVIVLITGNANDNLLRLGNNLSAYVYQVFRFLTFNTETQAFPFSDWPDEPVAEDNVWLEAEAEFVPEPEVASPEDAGDAPAAPEAEAAAPAEDDVAQPDSSAAADESAADESAADDAGDETPRT